MQRRRTIVSHVASEAFEPDVCQALAALGYDIVRPGEERVAAELRIIDDEILERVDGKPVPAVPLLLLTRDSAPPPDHPRVVDSVRQPAALQALYVALQTALEPAVRRFPRAATDLPAWCGYRDGIHAGAVVSLSEGGCRFRAQDDLLNEGPAIVLFRLPRGLVIKAHARTVYRQRADAGLAFVDLDPEVRSGIAGYVRGELVAAEASRHC